MDYESGNGTQEQLDNSRPRRSTVGTAITDARRRTSTVVSAFLNEDVGEVPGEKAQDGDGGARDDKLKEFGGWLGLVFMQVFLFKSNPPPSQNVKSVRLLCFALLGVCIGLLLRLGADSSGKQETDVGIVFYRLLVLPGKLFLSFLKMMIIPLIFSSIVSGVAAFSSLAQKGPTGWFCIAYIGLGTLFASFFGALWALLLRPGVYITERYPPTQSSSGFMESFNKIIDLIEDIVPQNILFELVRTEEDKPSKNRPNIISLLFFSAMLGAALVKLGDRGKPLLENISIFGNAVIKMWPQWLTPVGVCSIVIKSVSSSKDLGDTIGRMMTYFAVDIAAQIVLGFILIPLAYLIVARRNPIKYMFGLNQALVTAFGLASSAATIPYTMHCCEVINKVPGELVSFFIPLGTTLNMFGSAAHKGVAIYYMSVMGDPDDLEGTKHSWNFSQFILVVVMCWLITAGSAAIPSGSLATMPPIMESMGLTGDRIRHVTPIDWVLDRVRTTVNVIGTAFGVGMLHAFLETFNYMSTAKKLDEEEEEEEETEMNEVYKRTSNAGSTVE